MYAWHIVLVSRMYRNPDNLENIQELVRMEKTHRNTKALYCLLNYLSINTKPTAIRLSSRELHAKIPFTVPGAAIYLNVSFGRPRELPYVDQSREQEKVMTQLISF